VWLSNAREYVVPLFTARAAGNTVQIDARRFVGTAFFVTKQGDAITAGHVVPRVQDMNDGRRLVAVVRRNGQQVVCWVTHAARFEQFDVALVHINLVDTKFLPIAVVEVPAGTDEEVIGIPTLPACIRHRNEQICAFSRQSRPNSPHEG
jgi:hypothetical protein